MLSSLTSIRRQRKVLLMVAADAVLLPLALWCAYAMRMGDPFFHNPHGDWFYLLSPVVGIPIFLRLGLYRAMVRYMDDHVVWVVAGGVTLSVLVLLAVTHFTGMEVPRSVLLIYWGIAALYIGGSRFIARGLILGSTLDRGRRKHVVIYGAGAAGTQVALALRAGREYRVVAFVDDDNDRQGTRVAGIPVYSPAELPNLLDRTTINSVLFAMPSVSKSRRNAIMAQLESLQVRLLTVPGLADVVSGTVRVDEIREVEIEDLLGRDCVPPDPALLAANIRGRSVMVTGAGGSIGSELCRQILSQRPTRLVLFELTEYALYQIEQELRSEAQRLEYEVEIVPLLGSVIHQHRVEQAMRSFEVETVYHAAAYKHVPLVEYNPIEGIRNNVFGTWHTAKAAVAAGVRTFVLVSTDKAVRPTNVMGATKRFAELVLQAMAAEFQSTRFVMVRFGNVLGSSGSVVPLFRNQLKHGGPITLTHPEITRYFMTIPEASQLVIQAGAMGRGGDVFVLDMGKPVKIIDLARRMIHLSGLSVKDEESPDGDIEIRITGLRPGEKLFEELLIGENVTGTDHPLIMRAEEEMIPWSYLEATLASVDEACHRFDLFAIRRLLLQTVNGYQPTGDIEDLIWVRTGQAVKVPVTSAL
jgi:FlaA1/EpsC-like NDP-sugar epimerase